MLGDLEMAIEAYKISISYIPENCESLNNLAVIESIKNNLDSAINYAEKSFKEIANFEAAYNLSIWYYKTNQL
jgi:tetratricopeptide (TPR) repeat protein